MPVPLESLTRIVQLPDDAMHATIALGATRGSLQFFLYDQLRREQAAGISPPSMRSEIARILDLAQAALGDLAGTILGRDDALLDSARDGDRTLRDVMRHAIAVEVRYAAQVEYSATRGDGDPLPIPPERLPCGIHAPPEPEYPDTRVAGISRLVELLAVARARSDECLERLPDASLGRPSLWGTVIVDVRRRLHQVAAHLSETTVQIEKMLGPAAMGSEARRIMRRCAITRGRHERWSDDAIRRELDDVYRELAGAR